MGGEVALQLQKRIASLEKLLQQRVVNVSLDGCSRCAMTSYAATTDRGAIVDLSRASHKHEMFIPPHHPNSRRISTSTRSASPGCIQRPERREVWEGSMGSDSLNGATPSRAEVYQRAIQLRAKHRQRVSRRRGGREVLSPERAPVSPRPDLIGHRVVDAFGHSSRHPD